ncbi:hypothetical protein AGMMS49992_14090 [Clostridia bacterium]|nr:hypothetical protein AGMMS49992_14090 [Clostridia bacterium]
MQGDCSPERMDPRCGCGTGRCYNGRRVSHIYPIYGDSRYGGCTDLPANCDCTYPPDDGPPNWLCEEPLEFEEIGDGEITGRYGSRCETENDNPDDNPGNCKLACRFNDPKPSYCQDLEDAKNLQFEEIPDGTNTGKLFPACSEGHSTDPGTCLLACNPQWARELEQARPFLCPEKHPFETAPDGMILSMARCKGAPLRVVGWCRHAKSRRPGWKLCGGLNAYTKVCWKLNLCGGLRFSY